MPTVLQTQIIGRAKKLAEEILRIWLRHATGWIRAVHVRINLSDKAEVRMRSCSKVDDVTRCVRRSDVNRVQHVSYVHPIPNRRIGEEICAAVLGEVPDRKSVV